MASPNHISGIWGMVVAGGGSQRFQSPSGASQNKLLLTLEGKPVLWHSVHKMLIALPMLEGLIIIAHESQLATYQSVLKGCSNSIPITWTTGGTTRRASVWQGLQQVPAHSQWVIIHDAARPWVNPTIINSGLQQLANAPTSCLGGTLAKPISNSLKKAHIDQDTRWVEQTISRESLWEIHTPQFFRTESLKIAHCEMIDDPAITDDCELIERHQSSTQCIQLIEDEATNIKLTTWDDWLMIQALANYQSMPVT